MLGSMEFGCAASGAKVVVVLGHTACGAVKGAIDDVVLGNLTGLLARIKPAVAQTKYDGEKSSKNYAYVDAVGETNVRLAVAEIHRARAHPRGPVKERKHRHRRRHVRSRDRRSQVPGVGRWSVSKNPVTVCAVILRAANDPLLLILRSSHIGIGLSATASRPGIVCSPKDTPVVAQTQETS